MSTGGDSDEIDITLRDPDALARRIAVLTAVVHRLGLETRVGHAAPATLAEARFDLVAWLIDQQAYDAATPLEQSVLESPPGSLGDDRIEAVSGAAEALAALAWGGGLIDADMMALDPIDIAGLLNVLPETGDSLAALRADLDLRDDQTVWNEREALDVWAWRLETEVGARGNGRTRDRSHDEAIAEVAADAADAGVIPDMVGNDFPLDARPVREAAIERVTEAALIAIERCRALTWLCGFGASWDDVPDEV